MALTCDVLIVGGGMAGVSAAALLSEDAQVTLLEAETRLGTQSTGRSAALFIANYGNATLRALNAAALRVFEDPGGLSDRPILTPRGLLFVAREDQLEALEDYATGAAGLAV